MPCSYCKNPGHNRSTCPEAPQGVRKQRKPREGGKEFVSCPRGYRPVRMADGTIVLMKHQELCPEKVWRQFSIAGLSLSPLAKCCARWVHRGTKFCLPPAGLRLSISVQVMCECGVRVSAVDRRALMRHQSTKGHLEWASRE